MTTAKPLPLHTHRFSRANPVNRVFGAVYTCAIFSLLYHHALTALQSTTLLSLTISLLLLLSDILLGFLRVTGECFRLHRVYRRSHPENLRKVVPEKDFPAMDIFICTADPYKEPPINVVNTALSVMAYDYPTEKLSVYVSDDGGSAITLFAFMEAAKFGKHWLPFCKRNKILERCPDAFLKSNYSRSSETEHIKMMYESMKVRVENVLETGKVSDYITEEQESEAFKKWTKDFIRQEHPTVIQVLLESGKDRDITAHSMPNLIYVSRQKSKTSPHHFKAGALNVLLRVSAIMTNSPIILTLDCDMYSNDPQTPQRVLCYFSDTTLRPKFGYIQFPQIFHGLNKNDIYACEFKRVFQINPPGMDGLIKGTNFVGTGCFFNRRVFFGGPSSFVAPEILELKPDHVVKRPIQVQSTLDLAHRVADCNYENNSNWGSKMGIRYGSLVEDYYTGFRLLCEGWHSYFCHPDRPAFLGDVPITLNDVLNQTKRWNVGILEVGFCDYSPITYGVRTMGPIMGICYTHYIFWPIWSIPITIYAFLPQLALLNGVSIFPKVSDAWFFLYVFLFLGAYVQDYLDFVTAQDPGTFLRWWSDQRMWMIRGITAHFFGTIEYLTKCLGIPTQGFNVTSKVINDEQSKRYDQGVFEFGVQSPMFVPLAMASIINLAAFVGGLVQVFVGRDWDGLFVQTFIAGFVVLNSLPIYQAMVLRIDKGRMPTKTTIISSLLAWGLYTAASFTLKM